MEKLGIALLAILIASWLFATFRAVQIVRRMDAVGFWKMAGYATSVFLSIPAAPLWHLQGIVSGARKVWRGEIKE